MVQSLSILGESYGRLLLSGLALTLGLSVCVLALGFVWGTVLAVLRAIAFPPLQWLIAVYVEFHRNVPMLVQIFMWYFGVPQLLPVGVQNWINAQNAEFVFAFLALGSAFSAYVSEDLRSGIRALDPRQYEAARAMGFSYLRTMRWVIIPQAMRVATPALINQSLLFYKSTSLAMTIGVAELTYQTKTIAEETYRIFEIFMVSTIMYLVISFIIMAVGARFDARALGSR